MKERTFLDRLAKEIPVWVEKGWIEGENRQKILNFVAGQESKRPHFLILAISLMGVLLLGAGVITFFAAHWPEMAKLTKLGILFGSMWIVYSSVIFFNERQNSPLLGHALLLLGVILFGSNIMLISQIYHIDTHYPNGILIWSLGGLMAASLMCSQPALIASILLAILWTGMEIMNFDRSFNWPFLLVWTLFLPPVHQNKWKLSFHLALIGLLLWSGFVFLHTAWRGGGEIVYLVQVYIPVFLVLFTLGKVMSTYDLPDFFSGLLQRYASFGVLAGFYMLTFPQLIRAGHESRRPYSIPEFSFSVWVTATFIAMAVMAGLAAGYRWRTGRMKMPPFLQLGTGLLLLIFLLILVNLFIPGDYSGRMALFFNLVFFSSLVWLVYAAMNTEDRFLVNLAFGFFALALISRYFDTFWTLLNRSYFFMGGGLLLMVGGYFLEQQRRRLTRSLADKAKDAEGGGS